MIHIVGPNKFQNELLLSFLETQTSLQCKCYSEQEMSKITDIEIRTKRLALWDCLNAGTGFWDGVGIDLEIPECSVALFNVVPGVEKDALERGCRVSFTQMILWKHFSREF